MRHSHQLYPILSVEDALEKILSVFHPLEEERVPVLEALGCVLARHEGRPSNGAASDYPYGLGNARFKRRRLSPDGCEAQR